MQRSYTAPRWRVNLTTYHARRAVPAAVLLLAALALMAGAILVNLAPPNPYSAAALAVWRQGHFLNFNGLTRWVSTLWPFLTLPFLLLTSRRP